MSIDVETVRTHFPALAEGGAYFDGPGGTQTPDVVARAISDTLLAPLSNRGRLSPGERNAEATVTAGRQAMADLLGADPGGIVFGRSMTALTFEFSRALAKDWRPGDEIVVSRLDHDANVRPWVIAAQGCGASVRWIDFDPATGELTPGDVSAVLSDRTRLVALTGASNLLGSRPDLARIAALVHDRGALLYVDGVHLTAHAFIDVTAIGADFYACSPYKFFGPHCGVIAAPPQVLEPLRPDKLAPSSDAIPERFELGTLPYELLAGTAAGGPVVGGGGGAPGPQATAGPLRREALRGSWAALEEHEQRLRTRIEQGLAELPGIELRSRAASRTPTLLLTFTEHDPGTASRFLAERGVYAPAGTFYAFEVAKRLGLGDSGGVRIGLAPYHHDDDVDRLLAGLTAFLRTR